MPYKFNPFTGNLDIVNPKLDSPLLFKGAISAASDFPTSAEVETGWFYRVLADVTDNDGSKTNTGQSFLEDDEIAWNGSDWTELGSVGISVGDPISGGTANHILFEDGSNQLAEDVNFQFDSSTKDFTVGVKGTSGGDVKFNGPLTVYGETPSMKFRSDIGCFGAGFDITFGALAEGSIAFGASGITPDYQVLVDDYASFSVHGHATGTNSINIGYSGQVTASQAINIGANGVASNNGAINVGRSSTVSGNSGVNIGLNNNNSGLGALSMGINVDMSADYSAIIGFGTFSKTATNSKDNSILFAYNSLVQENLLEIEKSKGVRIGATSGETITMDGDDLYVVDEIEAGGNLTVGGDGTFTGNITIDNGGLTNNVLNLNGATHSYIRSTATDLLQLGHGGSDRLTIDSTGNVGIGTDSPDTALHVYKTAISGREQIAKFEVSDGQDGHLFIGNGTSVDNSFAPIFGGICNSVTNLWSMAFNGYVYTSDDVNTSNYGAVAFNAFETTSRTDPSNGSLSTLSNRRLFSFSNYNQQYLTIEADGNINIPLGNVSIGTGDRVDLLYSDGFPEVKLTQNSSDSYALMRYNMNDGLTKYFIAYGTTHVSQARQLSFKNSTGTISFLTGGTAYPANAQMEISDTEIDCFNNDITTTGDVTGGNLSGTNTGDITVTDSSEIDFTLTGQNLTASLIAGSIDETKLDASVNASLDLADSALQTYNETDTLDSVTNRGASTGNSITIGGTIDVGSSVGYKVVGNTSGNTRGSGALEMIGARFDNANVASGMNSLVIGNNAAATGTASSAIGTYAYSFGVYSFALGVGPYTKAGYYIQMAVGGTTRNHSATAMGISSTTNGYKGSSFGAYNVSQGTKSLSVGYKSKASATNSNSLGCEVSADGKNSLSIGYRLIGREDDAFQMGSDVSNIKINSTGITYNNEHPQEVIHSTGNVLATDITSLGSEKVTNGTFTGNATGWTLSGGWAYNNNRIYKNPNTTAGSAQQSVSAVVGEYYYLTFSATTFREGTLTVSLGGDSITLRGSDSYSTPYTSTSTMKVVFKATTTGNLIFTLDYAGMMSIDNVSVKKITGGDVIALGTVDTGVFTVANLPPVGKAGRRCFVSDANATTFASVVAGGGANGVPVYDDGTNWRIG